jgi:hypothetical protein
METDYTLTQFERNIFKLFNKIIKQASGEGF